jgi:predicted aldo/keto reductase-like oxidoreductase
MSTSTKKLGLGMMRLPMAEEKVDFDTTCRMVDLFLEEGGLWFDTAWGYHDGKSEGIVRRSVVQRHPREAFLLATKLPVWLVKEPGDARPLFDQQLERTGAGYFDRYLLHALNADRAKAADELGLWDLLKTLKAEGLVRSIGFSFHDTADVLDEILTAHPETEFVQLQINYMDWEDEGIQSRRCWEVARAHKTPIVIMEPVKGGLLAALPESVSAPLRALRPDWSDARWALAYCLSMDGIDLVLSGMSNMDQLRDNLAGFSGFEPLSAAERKALDEALARLKAMPSIACTACEYCLPECPVSINIPGIFETATRVMRFGPQPNLLAHYEGLITAGSGRAADCISCRACEGNCPQHLEIASLMEECSALLDPR